MKLCISSLIVLSPKIQRTNNSQQNMFLIISSLIKYHYFRSKVCRRSLKEDICLISNCYYVPFQIRAKTYTLKISNQNQIVCLTIRLEQFFQGSVWLAGVLYFLKLIWYLTVYIISALLC